MASSFSPPPRPSTLPFPAHSNGPRLPPRRAYRPGAPRPQASRPHPALLPSPSGLTHLAPDSLLVLDHLGLRLLAPTPPFYPPLPGSLTWPQTPSSPRVSSWSTSASGFSPPPRPSTLPFRAHSPGPRLPASPGPPRPQASRPHPALLPSPSRITHLAPDSLLARTTSASGFSPHPALLPSPSRITHLAPDSVLPQDHRGLRLLAPTPLFYPPLPASLTWPQTPSSPRVSSWSTSASGFSPRSAAENRSAMAWVSSRSELRFTQCKPTIRKQELKAHLWVLSYLLNYPNEQEACYKSGQWAGPLGAKHYKRAFGSGM